MTYFTFETAFIDVHSELKKCLQAINPLLILTHQQQTAFKNIVGKEEIACDEQFLLFPQCILLNQKIVSPFVNIYDISFYTAALEEPNICT